MKKLANVTFEVISKQIIIVKKSLTLYEKKTCILRISYENCRQLHRNTPKISVLLLRQEFCKNVHTKRPPIHFQIMSTKQHRTIKSISKRIVLAKNSGNKRV